MCVFKFLSNQVLYSFADLGLILRPAMSFLQKTFGLLFKDQGPSAIPRRNACSSKLLSNDQAQACVQEDIRGRIELDNFGFIGLM